MCLVNFFKTRKDFIKQMMPAECLLVFVYCIPWVTPGCDKRGGHRAEVVGQATPIASTHPPFLWKVGSQAADLKSLLFLTHLSHLFCGGHRNAAQPLHLLHPGLLTFLSNPWEAEEHLETASQQQELRRSCKTAKEALGEMKDCRLLHFDFF